jgi:hypothetical protein
MDESEKRGRRRQLPQQEVQQLTYSSISASTTSSNTTSTLPFISQQRMKRKISDHSIVALPQHLDFSYRDPSDATAKRRFQVKVPTKLLGVLALIFILIPGLIFLHKEIHIHEDHYESHFRTEKYIHVNTDEMFSKFRLATNQTDATTTTTSTIQHHHNDEEEKDTSTDASSILNIKAVDSVVITNHTINTVSGSGDMDHVEGDEAGDEIDESKLESSMVLDQDHELVPSSSSSTTEISSSKNTTNIEESNKTNDDNINIKAITNSTNNIPVRR